MQQHKTGNKSFLTLPGWTVSEPFKDTVKIGRQTIYVAGIEATHPVHGPVVGSAGSVEAYPLAQAWFEVIERSAILDNLDRTQFDCLDANKGRFIRRAKGSEVFPQTAASDSVVPPSFQYAKSNGVALHDSWSEACKRACFELVERHLVLTSWVGTTEVKRAAPEVLGSAFARISDVYKAVPLDFGSQAVTAFKNLIHVAGVVLLPIDKAHPLIIGFGAGFSKQDAWRKASGESWQRLGFLWGEEIPASTPPFLASPLYHQDYYLYPAHHLLLEKWFAGAYFRPDATRRSEILNVSFASMTSASRPEYFVSKALSAATIPLVFGRPADGLLSTLPEERIIHPIA